MEQRGNEFTHRQITIATHNDKIERVNRDQLRHVLKLTEIRYLKILGRNSRLFRRLLKKVEHTKAHKGLGGGVGRGR